jgi:hypothetical protein
MEELKGKTIMRVYQDNEYELFFIDSKSDIHKFTCTGDCCSESWWREICNLNEMVGKEITDVLMHSVQLEYGTRQDSDISEVFVIKCDSDYQNTIIEHRNSSNGYYSGMVEYAKVDELPSTAREIVMDFVQQ